jgi:DNA excision repair protein ERCC-4
MQTHLVVDSRERESRLTVALRELGIPTEVRRLTVGDYIAGLAIVERKSVRDLHLSIIQKRFWMQIGRLSRAARHPYLFVEGTEIDAGPLRPASVRGAILAVQELGIGVIRTSSPEDSALWLAILAGRSRRKARSRRVFAPRSSSPSEAMLAAVPGISVVTARALLERFGSVAAVIEAGPDMWLSTRGVGPTRAQALSETLVHSPRTPSPPLRGEPGPST